jgi:hypothetical protein
MWIIYSRGSWAKRLERVRGERVEARRFSR